MSTIAVQALTKRYGAVTAINDLSFRIAAGRITGFLGPNGAGKSTTMRILLGLARPTSGHATIDGQPYSTGGDVITALDGTKITSAADLQRAIDAKSPGDTVSVTYFRGGKTHTVQIKLTSRPS